MKLLTFLVVLSISVLAVDLSIQDVEKRECIEWQSTPGEFAEWQIEQCIYHQIDLK